MRISAIDRVEVRWILDRAGRFVVYPNGKLRPAWTYREISRNLHRSRGLKLSRYAVRRLVMREDFNLARRRGECFDIVRRLQHRPHHQEERKGIGATRRRAARTNAFPSESPGRRADR